MKKSILFLFLGLFCLVPFMAQAATLPERLSGRILLQVQADGEAWYVYPGNRLRYFLGRPADAFAIMRGQGRGISEADYQNFKNDPPLRLLGYIMLRIQANGEAYYVDPLSKRFLYLGRPADAFALMREKGLGINNENISHMPISGQSIIPPGEVMNIILEEPRWKDTIMNPVAIGGQARVFENSVHVRIRDASNKILANAVVSAQSPDVGTYGAYDLVFSYPTPNTATGYVEAFTLSAKDGTEIDKVITLVNFAKTGTLAWKTASDASGSSFLYPATLGTAYVSTATWPPRLFVSNSNYICPSNSSSGQTAITVNGHQYCETQTIGAAAGSIYTEYKYSFPENGRTASLSFTLRTVQCANYDEPQKTACTNEQAAFDVRALVDQMAGSLMLK